MVYYPTLREIIIGTLATIQSHPDIASPKVKSVDGVLVPIVKYRAYDGMELIEPGVTLSLFPRHTLGDVASEYKSFQVGSKHTEGFLYSVAHYLTLELACQGVAINANRVVNYYVDLNDPERRFRLASLDSQNHHKLTGSQFTVEINPVEEILREYLELIRSILEGIKTYLPWNISSSLVESVSFPTSSWSSDKKQIYFHRASLNWTLFTYDSPYRG